MRKSAVFVPLFVLSIIAACGGSDGAGQNEAADTASAAEVRACLEEAGITVTESEAFTDEAKAGLGIEEALSLAGDGEFVGLGGITWYKDARTAADAHEAGAAVRTDDVARAAVGTVAYHYAGADRTRSDAVAAIIVDCL